MRIIHGDFEISNHYKSIVAKNILDVLSILSVLQYIIFRYFQSTTFPYVYSETYKTLVFSIIVIVGSCRFLYIFVRKLLLLNNKDAKKRYFLRCMFCLFLSIPFIFIGLSHDLKVLVFMPFTALCLYDMEPEKVYKPFLFTITILLGVTVVCCLSGVVRNIAVIDYIGDYSYKSSYGVCNTTDFAAYILFIMLFAWCSSTKGFFSNSVVFGIFVLFIALITYYLSGSRTTLICCGLLSILCFVERIDSKKSNKNNRRRAIDTFIVASLPMMIVILGILVYLYGKGYEWTQILDKILSERLKLTYSVIHDYGITLLGTSFVMHGNGGTIFRVGDRYNFPDSSYAYLLIRYGIIITLIISILWVWIMIRSLKSGRKRLAYIMVIMSIYALVESHLFEINYNILIAMPFCSYKSITKAQNTEEGNKKRELQWYAKVPGIVTLIGAIFLFPTFISWLRTIVYLQGWNAGVSTIWPLLICLGFALLIVSNCIILVKRINCKTFLICFLSIIIVFFVGICEGNKLIQNGVLSKQETIDQEEKTIRLVQTVATQPVYAYEKNELYNRVIGGFENTILMPEDLCRNKQGTVFVDVSNEVLPVTICGGKYVQFSESSGLYSFDSEVFKALTSAGYELKEFYDSERECDLSYLAYLNDLSIDENGYLELTGKDKSLSMNKLLDQEIGIYEVKFLLAIPSRIKKSEENCDICNLLVTANNGDYVICEKEITQADFDENDEGCFEMTYFVGTVPKTEFLIRMGNSNTRVLVKRIAWRRLTRGNSNTTR